MSYFLKRRKNKGKIHNFFCKFSSFAIRTSKFKTKQNCSHLHLDISGIELNGMSSRVNPVLCLYCCFVTAELWKNVCRRLSDNGQNILRFNNINQIKSPQLKRCIPKNQFFFNMREETKQKCSVKRITNKKILCVSCISFQIQKNQMASP